MNPQDDPIEEKMPTDGGLQQIAEGKALTEADANLFVDTRGEPVSLCFSVEQKSAYIADIAHKAVLYVDSNGSVETLVNEYEGCPLLGPSSIALGTDGTIFFTDSGPFGETSIQRPMGSVYAIKRDQHGSRLVPLLHNCLAHPCAIAVSSHGEVFVAELMLNRVLRLVPQNGVYHTSVYLQLQSQCGPSALAIHDSALHVARFDLANISNAPQKRGMVSTFDLHTGAHLSDTDLDGCGPEISTIVVCPQSGQLICAETSTKRIVLN